MKNKPLTILKVAKSSSPKWCKWCWDNTRMLLYRKRTVIASYCSLSTITSRMYSQHVSSSYSPTKSCSQSSLEVAHRRQVSIQSSSRVSSSNARVSAGHLSRSSLSASWTNQLRNRKIKKGQMKKRRKQRRRKLQIQQRKAQGLTTRDYKQLSFTKFWSRQVWRTKRPWNCSDKISPCFQLSLSKSSKLQRHGNRRKWKRLANASVSSLKQLKQYSKTKVEKATNSSRQSLTKEQNYPKNSRMLVIKTRQWAIWKEKSKRSKRSWTMLELVWDINLIKVNNSYY